jgi:regulator of protease activity HflC (stomatin/prohibitin superfamily)
MGLILIQAAGIGFIVVLFAAVLFVVFILANAVRILKEYERGVIFRLGRVQGQAKGPGLIFLIPIVDKMVRVGLRTVSLAVPPQEVITRDNVPARVDAVIYFRVIDSNRSILEVENYALATSQISQTTLRSVLGQKDLDDLLSNREAINQELQVIIDEHTEPWGVKVSAVEVKDVEIPKGMQRAMARQAESERERRAKIISAEGEYQASQRLHDAAERLESPTALQLRLFQTLTEISSENNSTVILPVPIDLFRPYLGGSNGSGDGHAQQAWAARRRGEGEAERLYEEAVGKASSEQQAVQGLDSEGADGHTPAPIEDATKLGEEPPGEEPARPGYS